MLSHFFNFFAGNYFFCQASLRREYFLEYRLFEEGGT